MVEVRGSAEFTDGAYDEGFVIVVTNRAGRSWSNLHIDNCPANAAESAMATEEFINGGGKLTTGMWKEIA